MAERKRSTVRDLRRDNRSVLLWSLFIGQPCSRQDLSWATGLSTASVSNVVREFIDEGIVTEAGSVDSDGGRPRALLQMDPDYGRVIGVDVGETRIRVEMFDMTMAMRASADYSPRRPGAGHRRGRRPGQRRASRACSRTAGATPRRCSARASGFPGSSSTRARRPWSTRRPTAGTRCRSAGCCAGRRLPALHRERGQDDGAGRTVVRRRPRRPSGRGLPDGLRPRREHRHRFPRPGRHGRRGRVGAHHGGGGRPILPVRLPRLPGGVRRRRGDPGPVRAVAAGQGRGVGAGRAGRGGRRAVGRDPRRDRAVPRAPASPTW